MTTDPKMSSGFIGVLQDALDRPIAFHRAFVKLTGSVTAALMLSQAMYWSKRTKSDGEGWFYKTGAQWEEETGLTRREQEFARKTLRSFSFWKEKLRGVPAQMYYRIDITALSNELLRFSEGQEPNQKPNEITRLHESAKLVCTKAPNKNGGNVQTSKAESAQLYTKTTTEITTKTTTTHARDLGGRVFVEKLIVGTMLHAADPKRISSAAKKFNRQPDELEKMIDILNQQYQQGARGIDNPTALVVSALKDGIDIPDGYIPKAQRDAVAAQRSESDKKRAEQERIAKETEDNAFMEAEKKLASLPDKKRNELFSKAAKRLPAAVRNSRMAIKTEALKLIIADARAPS